MDAHPDHWYPIAWADEVKAGKALGRRYAGQPIVLYRGKEGRVFALEDRCAHRQAPLRLGVVDGERIKCHYHGWAYDQTGKCVDVPYLGKERLPNGVKAYPTHEIDDLMRPRGADARKDFSDHMRIRTDYPTQNLKVWVGRDIQDSDDPVLDVWLGYTPLDAEQRANRTFGYLSVKRPPMPGLIEAAWPFVVWFTEGIFAEDKDIVEFEQRAYQAQGGDWNNEVFPALRDLRDVLARCGVARAD